MIIKASYDYDDLMLVPRASTVNSRNDVDLSVDLGKFKLDIPIIASPMKGITSPELIITLGRLGGIGILHRFYENVDVWLTDLRWLAATAEYESFPFGVAIGLREDKYQLSLDVGASIICIDIANGYLDSLKRYCEMISNNIHTRGYSTLLMAGNVVTDEGAVDLFNCGVDIIRVGIGSGQQCTTRTVTGVGYPQLSAIEDCRWANVYLVADGGITNSGRAVKALAAGADLVMIGSLFGACKESSHNGIIYGMASKTLQEEYYHNTRSIEGTETPMEKTTTVEEFINTFTWGMKSGFTYMNAKNINELQRNAEWIITK